MKHAIVAAILFASAAWAADEISDKAAIEKTVHSLSPVTADFDGAAELARLSTSRPAVVVSKEPMGEAQIVVPFGKLVVGRIRFITRDVALVDAAGNERVLFVVKREGSEWKIASLRILQSR